MSLNRVQRCLSLRAGKIASTPDGKQIERHSLFIFIYSILWCPWLPRGATESSFYCAARVRLHTRLEIQLSATNELFSAA